MRKTLYLKTRHFHRENEMNYKQYVEFLNAIEKLKCNTRHCWTTSGRQESVAEHSWRLAVMAMLCRDEYLNLDIDKVIKMCLIHDLGEAITGDIPAFLKTDAHEAEEENAIVTLLNMLPDGTAAELGELFNEMSAMESDEARLYKALDNLEALIAHNESDISTWLPREYEDNLTYGQKNCEFSEWTMGLKKFIKSQSIEKMEREKSKNG